MADTYTPQQMREAADLFNEAATADKLFKATAFYKKTAAMLIAGAEAMERAEKAADALRASGNHDEDCKWFNGPDCDCGYDAAVAAARKEQGP